MRLHRFYIKENQGKWTDSGIVIHDPVLLHQWIKVLRFVVGNHVCVFHETKGEYEVIIDSLTRKESMCSHVKHLKPAQARTEEGVTLYVSLIKKDRFEWIVEKATELGVHTIVPLVSERTTTKSISLERCERIVIEATEQSQQLIPPRVHAPLALEKAIKKCEQECVVLHTEHDENDKKTSLLSTQSSKNIFVGPEGGWGDSDHKIFKKYEAHYVTLNTPVLRAETAAIIAVYEFGTIHNSTLRSQK